VADRVLLVPTRVRLTTTNHHPFYDITRSAFVARLVRRAGMLVTTTLLRLRQVITGLVHRPWPVLEE
jgi:hypothetical protein